MDRKKLASLVLVWTLPLSACAQVTTGLPDDMNNGFGGDLGSGGAANASGGTPSSGGTLAASGGTLSTGGSSTGGATATGGTAATGGAATGGGGGLQPVADCTLSSECNDLSPCTTDVCTNGSCVYNDNATCECKPASAVLDCDDGNECTTNTCVDHQCVIANSTSACADDGDACTTDICAAGNCTHPDSGVCSANTVVIRSMRDAFAGQWVSLNSQSALVWNTASALGQAELFEKEELSATTFKLKALSNGKYVVLGAGATIEASGGQVAALVFQTTPCGTGIGLQNTAGGSFAKAEGSGLLVSSGTGCNADNAAAWERFEFIDSGN